MFITNKAKDMKYTISQEDAIKMTASRHSDVVMSSYKDIKIIRATSPKDQPILIVFRGRSAKAISNYYYRSYELREDAIKGFKKRADEHEEYDLKKKADKKALGSPKSEIGTIFVDSWGYDQTNVDYYQIIERPSKHFAVVRQIGSSMVEGSAGYDCCNVVPVKDSFCGDPFRAKLSLNSFSGKGVENFKTRSYSSAHTWDGRENYKSWYA